MGGALETMISTWEYKKNEFLGEAQALIDTALRNYRPRGLVPFVMLLGSPGQPLTTGDWGDVDIDFPFKIQSARVFCKESAGSCVVDIRTSTYATFPTTASICGGVKPTLSGGQKAETTISSWTKDFDDGATLSFVVDNASITGVVAVKLQLRRK